MRYTARACPLLATLAVVVASQVYAQGVPTGGQAGEDPEVFLTSGSVQRGQRFSEVIEFIEVSRDRKRAKSAATVELPDLMAPGDDAGSVRWAASPRGTRLITGSSHRNPQRGSSCPDIWTLSLFSCDPVSHQITLLARAPFPPNGIDWDDEHPADVRVSEDGKVYVMALHIRLVQRNGRYQSDLLGTTCTRYRAGLTDGETWRVQRGRDGPGGEPAGADASSVLSSAESVQRWDVVGDRLVMLVGPDCAVVPAQGTGAPKWDLWFGLLRSGRSAIERQPLLEGDPEDVIDKDYKLTRKQADPGQYFYRYLATALLSRCNGATGRSNVGSDVRISFSGRSLYFHDVVGSGFFGSDIMQAYLLDVASCELLKLRE